MRISIGVVIPVFNRPDLACRAIRSVLAQTRPPEHVVVIDDASSPPLLLPPDLSDNPVLKCVRLEHNGGPAMARQVGVSTLDTSHVAFLDSDDYWLPGKLAAQSNHIQGLRDPERVSVACCWRYEGAGEALGRLFRPRGSDQLRDFVSGCWFCPGSTTVVPRQALENAGGFDVSLRRLEDLDLFIRLAQNSCRLELASVDGAVIKRGANARRVLVDAAARHLQSKYLRREPHEGGLPDDPALRRRCAAWLALEMARGARDDRDWPLVVFRLARSFALVPRRRLQLSNWWQKE